MTLYFVVANLCPSTGGSILEIEEVTDGSIPTNALKVRGFRASAMLDMEKISQKFGGKAIEVNHCIGKSLETR